MKQLKLALILIVVLTPLFILLEPLELALAEHSTIRTRTTTTSSSQHPTTNQNMSAAFGEWALIDSEVVPVQNVMQKYNWTQTALHHHMLNESPKILFLHWSVTGNANDLINKQRK